jgi:ADP-heptose:LPS heptosyltransferase
VSVLILKLSATGDVVRTSTLLHRLEGDVTWITASGNVALLDNAFPNLRCLGWDERAAALDRKYELVINLEDELDVALFEKQVERERRFGAYTIDDRTVVYTENARQWFDMSLVSAYGRERADELKFLNRRSYQELIFEGLGFEFRGEPYVLPSGTPTGLIGDVAMAPVAGAVWPMKNWAYYDELKEALEKAGFGVNVLPRRETLLEHLADVQGHRCLVGGDSLPMHLALGSGVRCVTIFNCTSPWEIYDYGLQTKIVSPRLGEFFYKRGLDESATMAVRLEDVLDAVLRCLDGSGASRVAR